MKYFHMCQNDANQSIKMFCQQRHESNQKTIWFHTKYRSHTEYRTSFGLRLDTTVWTEDTQAETMLRDILNEQGIAYEENDNV